MSQWTEFESKMFELRDLAGATGILSWDQETFMPPKASASRGEQLGTLQALYHERLTSPRLEALAAELGGKADLSPIQQASVRNLAREQTRAKRLPSEWVRELAETQATSVEAWKVARKEHKFDVFAPHLEKLIRLRRQQAELLGSPSGEAYDALLENFEPGMLTGRLEPLFAELRAHLVDIVKKLAAAKAPDTDWVAQRKWDLGAQQRLSEVLLAEMGFDFEAGRQDRSTHPFTQGAGYQDVRLTNRFAEDDPFSSIFSALHEGGHGLYEQGFAPALHRTFASGAPSMGIHESQSRLWENLVGRSEAYWQGHVSHLQRAFPEAMLGVTAKQVVQAINKVEPSLIRVEADEVTYNLHILLRFELELGILRGELNVRDLPAAWNEKMEKYLGIRPPNDGVGVLQDIHWAWGEFGYFPTYTLGNLYSVCIFEAAQKALPTLDADLTAGKLLGLREWLRTHIHAHGFTLGAEERVQAATGQALSVGPFVRYLKQKFGALYGVAL
jgi:carboxypeptidase Taq